MALTKIDDRGLTTPIDLLDNEKIRFGTDNDIEIYHTGSHGYIDCATGNLLLRDTGAGSFIIRTNDFNVQNAAGGETMIWGDDDAAVKLYYDGSPKFETTGNGAKVTGTAGSYALEVNHPDWNTLKLINTNANTYGPYLDMYHNSASPADGDEAGEIRFLANDDAGGSVVYGQMRVVSYDVSNGSEDGQFDLQLRNNDVLEEKLKITSAGNALFSANEVKLYNATDTSNTYFYAQNTGAGNAGIKMKNSSGEWTIIANDRLRFIDDDAGLERLSILSDGNVGIGTTSPTTPDGSNADNPLNGTPVLSLYGDSPAINLVSSTTTSDDWSLINFGRTGSTTNPYRAVIGYHQSADTLRINANNAITFDVGGAINTSEKLRILSGGGITFNGDTAAANALDDYEEGTWTPAAAFATSGSATSPGATGKYTKIGNMVYVDMKFYTTAISSPSGAFSITGLPFAPINDTFSKIGISIGFMREWATDMPNFRGLIGGSSQINFYKQATDADPNSTAVEGSDFRSGDSDNYIYAQACYVTPT